MSETERPHETVDKTTREQVLDRDGHQCMVCSRTGPGSGGIANLEVHHIDRDPEDMDVHDPDNLITLCRACHIWHHQQPERTEIPVELTPVDEVELVPYDKEILRVLAEDGPLRPGEIRDKLSFQVAGDSIRQGLWRLMGLDNKVAGRDQQIVDQDVDTGEWGLVDQIAESPRGRIPDDPQRLILRFEDETVRQALEKGYSRETVADVFDVAKRTIFNKEKRAYAYDFPADALKGGRRGWNGGGDSSSDEGKSETSGDEAVTESRGDVEVWSASGTDESVTAAEMLDDADGGEVDSEGEGGDGDPSTHLDRAIAALEAAKSGL